MRTRELDDLLRRILKSGDRVSDVNFTPGKPPQVETDGNLVFPFTEPPLPELTPYMTEQIAVNLLHDRADLMEELFRTGSCDCAYEVPGLARFRANVFTQRGAVSIVLRKLEMKIATIHDLILPLVFQNMATLHKGLVLITGATGQGKSTTLAALVHEINMTRPVHVISLEDPIEFVHRHQIGTVNQRELGQDFSDWASGVRAAMRQAPKVIVLGELRDRETMETAVSAAETGHLVFATMHTMGAGETINRLVGMFPASEQPRLRARLADTIQYIVAQWLVPREEGGRIAALEILAANLRTREIIREGESGDHKTFYRALSDDSVDGMQTFDQHLLRLVDEGFVSRDTVLHYCTDRVFVSQSMDRMEHAKAAATGEPDAAEADDAGLKMNFGYGRQRRGGKRRG